MQQPRFQTRSYAGGQAKARGHSGNVSGPPIMPELHGAEITFLLANGSQKGPYILRCAPFEPGASALDGKIDVQKERVFVSAEAEREYLDACADYEAGLIEVKPKRRDFTVQTGQFTVRVNGKVTERYTLRFPRRKPKKSRFGYI